MPAKTKKLSDIVAVDIKTTAALPPPRAPRFLGIDYGVTERSIMRDLMRHGSFEWIYLNQPMSAFAEPVAAPSRATLTRVPAVDLAVPCDQLAVEAEMLLGYAPLLQHTCTPGRLRRALAKLEIEVLDQASVDAYKKQMVQHYASHKKMLDPTWRVTSLREYRQPVPEYVLAKAVSIKKELPEAEFYVDQLAVDPFLIVSLTLVKDTWTNVASRELDAETQAYIEVWDEPKFETK